MSEAVNESCPFCGASLGRVTEACPSCDLPLVGSAPARRRRRSPALFDGAAMLDDALPDQDRHAELADDAESGAAAHGGQLRCVVVAINEAEAEMLSEMLRHEGLPSIVRTPGLNSYAQGSLRCEVLVPQEVLPAARQLLQIEPEPNEDTAASHLAAVSMTAILLGIAAALALLITFAS